MVVHLVVLLGNLMALLMADLMVVHLVVLTADLLVLVLVSLLA